MIRQSPRVLFIALGLLAVGPPTASAQFYRPERIDVYLRDNAKMKALVKPTLADAAKSIVKIFNDKKEVCLGTVVGRDGWIITKYSELRSDNLKVKFKDGREFAPKIVGVEDRYDLALLKIDARDLVAVDWRDSKSATLGRFVVTPGIDQEPIAIGVVGVLTRSMKLGDYPVANRSRTTGWLGVQLGDAEGGGARIGLVVVNGSADKAGLKAKDVVVSISGRKIGDSDAMMQHLLRYRIGEEVTLTVKRGEEELELTATLGKKPTDQGFSGMDRGLFQNGIHKDLSDVNVGFPTALQHDSVLKAREVGGPLVDLDGKVLGVNIASSGRVDSYTVPSEVIQGLLPDLMSGKLAPCVQVKKSATPKKTDDEKNTSTGGPSTSK